jgi:hypothetical protein
MALILQFGFAVLSSLSNAAIAGLVFGGWPP